MADLSYNNTVTPVYNPTSQIGSDSNYGSPTAPGFDGYHTTVGMTPAADPYFDSTFFANNLNAANPYNKTYTQTIVGQTWQIVGYDQYGMPIMQMRQYSYNVYPTNPAYTDFENKATAAQNTYLSQQQANYDAVNDKASSDLIASYGNAAVKPQFKSDIALLSELNNLKNQLQFQDDITKYLNRVTDSSNISAINDLQNRIAALENSLSQELLKYYQQQEIIRAKENEFFTWDFAWLSDPYFGRGGGQIYQQYLQEQQFISNNIAMISDGSIYDWLAGGIYLNAVMPGGEMSAGYMPNDYYSVGLQYQVTGTNINEGGANAFPWDSMAGGASFGLNSSSRTAYKVLEL